MDNFTDTVMRALFGGEFRKTADKIGTDNVGGYTIDTCDTICTGYETAIWKGDYRMIIVERYRNHNDAVLGHEKWCKFCETEPKEVYSVQCDKILKFEEYEDDNEGRS